MDNINEINMLRKRIEELEEQLQKYQHNKNHIKYYENNKDIVKERAKKYMNKVKETNPEKLKEWRHTAYIKRKEKLQKQNEEQT